MANIIGTLAVALFSQTAWLALFLISRFPILTSSSILVPSAVIMLLLVTYFMKKILPSHNTTTKEPTVKQRGLLYYTCCLFSWTCIVDLIFYLEVVEAISGFFGFYLETGEPYFATSFGALALLWDVIVHFPLYLAIIYCIDNGFDYRNIVLFWCGSMITSLFCLLLGALGGTFGSNIYPSTFLNAPYVILPIYFLFQTLNESRKYAADSLEQKHLNHQYMRYLLIFGSGMIIVFSFVRGLAALNSPFPIVSYYSAHIEPYITDPSLFGAIWVLFYMFVGSLLQMGLLFGLLHRGSEWMLDLSVILTAITFYGSYLQFAQFCSGVKLIYHPPANARALVIVGNLLLPAVALGTAVLCHFEPNYFSKRSIKNNQ